jgi:alpha-glucosidase
MEKMGYLKGLGVEAIYLNPVFVSPSSHKYDVQDYDHVDPHFGVLVKDGGSALTFDKFNNRYATKYMSRTADTANLEAGNALLAELIALAHQNGIRVILDGVFNHCGSFNKWLDRAGFYHAMGYPPGAYRLEESPYHDYFTWYDDDWPNNDCYDGWWGNENLPKLNYEDAPELYDYILDVAKKWVSPPYNADGWRLDVAADLGHSEGFNHEFWRDFREAVKGANPDALIIAEHYGDASPWTSGGEWDTVMNYGAFMEPLTWFLTGMSKHSEDSNPALRGDAMAFENAMRYHMALLNHHSLSTAMNQLSNHDHSRFLTRTNGTAGRLHTKGARAAEQGVDKGIMMAAVVFQMTWQGAPTLYYGDEAGLAGWTDPDCRRPYPWGREDASLMELHRMAIKLRREHTALRTGSAEFLYNDRGFISFGRWNDTERFAVALNNNAEARELSLPVWKTGCFEGAMECVLRTDGGRAYAEKKPYEIKNGTVKLTVPGYGSAVLRETLR